MKKLICFLFLFGIIFLCSGCFDWNNLENATIYTTVYPLQYLTETLYGEYSTSSSIYPNGTNPSEYTLSEKQTKTFSEGTLFVYNGTTNEKQIAKSFINRNKKLKIIDVAHGLKYTNGVEELWLSPSNYLMLATNFKENLESLVGSKYVNEEIEKKYHELEEDLSIMDAEIRKIATDAKEQNRETIIATSKMFKFLENYGFKVVCLEDYEENSANLNTLKNNFKIGTYKYLLKKSNEELSSVMNELKNKCSATIIDVEMMSSLSDKQVAENDSYFTIMNDFIANLKMITNN